MNYTQQLEKRRQELGMTYEALSQRSGVPVSTLKSIVRKGVEHSTFANVGAIAEALGVDVEMSPRVDSVEFRYQQAMKKAKALVGLVQGSSALEAQAVDDHQVDKMVRELVHQLMAGSPRKLWA